MRCHSAIHRVMFLLLLPACKDPKDTGAPQDTAPQDLECDTGQVFDGEACVPEVCGSTRWGSLETTDSTIFVDASAQGGDGSESAPFATIGEGLSALAGVGGMLAVTSGMYRENLALDTSHDGVTLAGRCPELVVLDGSAGAAESAGIAIEAGRETAISISGITLTGAPSVGLMISGGVVAVTDSIITANSFMGVVASGTESMVDLSRVEISATLPDAQGDGGYGVYASDGADLTCQDCLVTGNTTTGVAVQMEATAHFVVSEVGGTLPNPQGYGGFAFYVTDMGNLVIETSRLGAADMAAIAVGGPGTEAHLIGGTTISRESPMLGEDEPMGAWVDEGALLTADGTEISGFNVGIYASMAIAALQDVRILDSASTLGATSYGVYASDQADLEMSGGEITGTAGYGFVATDPGTLATLDGVTVSGCLSPDGNMEPVAVVSADGANLDMANSFVRDNLYGGISAVNPGTLLTVTDSVVSGTLASDSGRATAISAFDGAQISVLSSSVADNETFGVMADGPGTEITLQEVEIRGTTDAGGSSVGGVALAFSNAAITLDSCLFEDNDGYFLYLDGLSSATILDTDFRDQNEIAGKTTMGVAIMGGSAIEARGWFIDDMANGGIYIVDPGTRADLAEVEISNTRSNADGVHGAAGLIAESYGSVEAQGLIIEGTEGPGLYARSLSSLSCLACTLSGNTFAGAMVLGATLAISDSVIDDNGADASLGGGVGILATSDDNEPAMLLLDGSSVEGSPVAAVWISGPGTYALRGNSVGDTVGKGICCGDAVYAEAGVTAWDGATGLLLESNEIVGAIRAGVLLDGASASLAGNTWQDDAVDLVVQGKGCEVPPTGWEEAPNAEICPVIEYCVTRPDIDIFAD